ncbi:Type 4 prepilin-like proteins leader peptide-processing enzyme [Sporotomaculum syntrophicum]|uniref:Type 4 prepilin-like proteins leader peptide-processing enzyme n=1 Tax=Sporotomaculum syntrophicum TaxID=182264 RepID=A0A9D2WT05_9FIRM|nr:A24 family peptidase [Sporotomaculum syntrophicum]KAF1086553.1 Type 4 prepilin-like proteins leader peptide-processing enzyme [Sporotomaculum syntrophicum]
MYFVQVLVFIIGACIGSFLNVCIYRLPRGQSVVSNPSHCPGCGRRLGVPDLVPLLSYVLLKGRCRYCGERISARYPLVELLTALLFLVAYHFWGLQWQTVAMWLFFAVLVTAAFIDFQHKIIPDELILAGGVLGLPLVFLSGPGKLVDGLIGFLFAGLLFLFIAVVSNGGMGGGDIKLSALMGLYLGFPNIIVALFSSFLLGGLSGIALMALRAKNRKDSVPFGPFLAFGSVLAAFYSGQIIRWYLHISGL